LAAAAGGLDVATLLVTGTVEKDVAMLEGRDGAAAMAGVRLEAAIGIAVSAGAIGASVGIGSGVGVAF
jgi:hypothetical protein